jgi:serine beta-lactamase-like protein LACTB
VVRRIIFSEGFMVNNRGRSWLVAAGTAAGVLVAAVLGVILFLNLVSTPLHPSPDDVPSAMATPPDPKWARAVERGRRGAREGLVEKNLPGLSVAVGVNGELVWAEGFGWADVETRAPVTPRMRFRIGHVSKALTSAAAGLRSPERRGPSPCAS